MIQRIQSIFLLIVVIVSVLMFFVSVAEFTVDTTVYEQTISCTYNTAAPGECLSPTYYIAAINGVIGLVALVTIFLFRNRKLQMLLGNLNMVLIVTMIVLMFLAIDKNHSALHPDLKELPMRYKLGAYLPILMIIFTFLANRFIKKDEELVRSADRIR